MEKETDTRLRILAAAEHLFAERGVAVVSLAEINQAAGQRNSSAIHYHFGSREGLLDAVLARHMTELDLRRGAMLDALEAADALTLPNLMRALVSPLAERLDHASGRCFLRIQAQGRHADAARNPAARRLVGLIEAAMRDALPAAVARARGEFIYLLLFPALAERARAEEERRAKGPRALFERDLVDALVGILTAPVSERGRKALSA